MPSLIWRPVEEEASHLKFGTLTIIAHVRNGQVFSVEIPLGQTVRRWTVKDVEHQVVEE